ncbi:MAG: DUF4091 domain-containing protein, partial [Proteobacteria bacterium]|nr:DUF4091 domain-containing protein [Pseudomonadota bacterium]
MKQFLIDHRLTPKSTLWPGGLTSNGGAPFIDYDGEGQFSDPHGIWGFEHPADKYLKGNGFNNGHGFPSFVAMTFRNNDASQDQRPATFAGVTRSASDWYSANNPNSAYNKKWFQYMGAIESYLTGKNLLEKSYYYLANEPQDQSDYDAVSWYTQELKKAAPNLKLMVSEEPKSEIFSNSSYPGAKVDIWLSVLNNYDPQISFEREKSFNEETWLYFLHGTRPPYFNPITLDHPGEESKFTGWFLWKYRARGIAYYSMNNWSKNPWTDPMTDNHNGDLFMLYPPSETNQSIAYGSNNHRLVPSIRLELMRDGLEDFEYLHALNGNKLPEVDVENPSDSQAGKIISSLTSYTYDGEFIANLRRLIGLKNGGEISTIPDIQPGKRHPRTYEDPSNYYINFQDPHGEPLNDPLVVDGKTYDFKIGWSTYNLSEGYGWYGDMAHVMYKYASAGPNELQMSILYDDWGRVKTFDFDLPNGTYDVTVSVGWPGKSYSRHKIDIEGIPFVDDEKTTSSAPFLVRTKKVTISDY